MSTKKRTPSDFLKALFSCKGDKLSWSPCKITGVTVLGLLVVATGCLSCVMWFTDIYVDSILNVMTIRKESAVYEAWRKPPVKPLICIHVFNYTNLDRFYDGLDPKIKLQQAGPYCYRETLEKKNITWNDDGTITYGDTRTHKFEPEHSNGTEEDVLIVPNLALISTIGIVKDYNYVVQKLVSGLLNTFDYNESLMTVTARDYFFGYDDKLIDFATRFAKLIGEDIPFDKFGLLSRRAAITDETITVATGTDDLENIGVVKEVDGMTTLGVWGNPECDRIDGSDGAFFPRHGVNESATIYLFHRDLCRRIPFKYQKKVDFQDGIIAMRFAAPPDVYNTDGTCFCPEGGCSPNGVFDLSTCAFGVPVMMSFPHFLHGNQSLLDPFEGLKPDAKKHEFYIDVQGKLGFTLGTVSRLQLNLRVEKADYIYVLDEFPDNIILPIIWIQVSAERMPPDLFNLIYHATFTVQRIQDGLRWGSLITTLILAAFVYYIMMRPARLVKQSEKEIPEAQEMLQTKEPVTITLYPKISS